MEENKVGTISGIGNGIFQEIVGQFLLRGVLLGPDVFGDSEVLVKVSAIDNELPHDMLVLTNDVKELLRNRHQVDWFQLDRLRTHYERGRAAGYLKYLEYFLGKHLLAESALQSSVAGSVSAAESSLGSIEASVGAVPFTSVNVLFSYDKSPKKHDVTDFVQYFNNRYKLLEKILKGRMELHGVISISRVLKRQAKENVSIIGMVVEKAETKNGNIMLILEDPTGRMNVLVNKNKPDLFSAAKDIVYDEVVGVVGVSGERIIFANNLIWPDVPPDREIKKAPDDIYALFLSDVHVGSKLFLGKEFNRFLKWINGRSGSEAQKEIAKKVGYIFIVGDLVDGVGVYPGQDNELAIKDIYEQYREFARLIGKIPKQIKIIVCPGNHDAVRMSEPQPLLDPDFAAPLYEIPNITIVSNPALVNIHAKGGFEGLNVLIYHGYCFDHYVASVDSIRNWDPERRKSGYERADLIMKYLLKRRHLAPDHESTLHFPDTETDPLVITTIPDIFATGHIHYSLVGNYRGIALISGSCWQGKTTYQEKFGHKPQPARVPAINLSTMEPKILKFADDSEVM